MTGLAGLGERDPLEPGDEEWEWPEHGEPEGTLHTLSELAEVLQRRGLTRQQIAVKLRVDLTSVDRWLGG